MPSSFCSGACSNDRITITRDSYFHWGIFACQPACLPLPVSICHPLIVWFSSFFLVPSFILPSTVFMSLIHSVDAGWKMWKSCKKQTDIFSQKYSWICFMFLSLFKLLYFCFVNIIKLSPLHWANYSSYCIDTKPNMFITESCRKLHLPKGSVLILSLQLKNCTMYDGVLLSHHMLTGALAF